MGTASAGVGIGELVAVTGDSAATASVGVGIGELVAVTGDSAATASAGVGVGELVAVTGDPAATAPSPPGVAEVESIGVDDEGKSAEGATVASNGDAVAAGRPAASSVGKATSGSVFPAGVGLPQAMSIAKAIAPDPSRMVRRHRKTLLALSAMSVGPL